MLTSRVVFLGTALLGGAMCVPLPTALAQDSATVYRPFSGALEDIVTNLYGGDGIFLRGSDVFSHAAHFTGDSLEQFNQLSLSVRDLSFPVLNPQIGARFKYDAVLDEFVPVNEAISASAFAFDAQTVGKGEFHFGIAYSNRRFDELDGVPLNSLTVDLAHIDLGDNGPDLPCIGGPVGACYAFERDVVRLDINLGIKEEMLALNGAYGITDRLELGVFVPLLRTAVDVSSMATIIENETRQFFPASVHLFGGDSTDPNDALSASRTGIGDVILRTNYALTEVGEGGWDVMAGADLRLPSGDVRNLQGLPDMGIRPRLVVSRDIDLGHSVVRPHLNVSYGFNTGINNEQMLDYAIGGSWVFKLNDDSAVLAIGADFLGHHVTAKTDNMADNQYDLSIGAKLHVNHSISAYYNILLPMDDAGLRPDAQHVFGLQFEF